MLPVTLYSSAKHLSVLLDNENIMRLLSGAKIMFERCFVFAHDAARVDAMFETEAAAKYDVEVQLWKCEVWLAHTVGWAKTQVATHAPCRAKSSALGISTEA